MLRLGTQASTGTSSITARKNAIAPQNEDVPQGVEVGFNSNATLLSRNLGRHTELSASLYNLFDKNYADPGAEEHEQDALRQDGRNFRVKLTFRF